MKTAQRLRTIINVLKGYRIGVRFVRGGTDQISIGELRDGVITVNTTARDQQSIIFMLAHLFGHYCQFQNYPKYQYLIESVNKPRPAELSLEFKRAFFEYEREAFGIGLSLMREGFSVDEKLYEAYSVFMRIDFDQFWGYVTENVHCSPLEFKDRLKSAWQQVKLDLPVIEALPIPKVYGNTRGLCITVN